jgi:hypothetical protein
MDSNMNEHKANPEEQTGELPPKKGTAQQLVTLEPDVEKVLRGEKTATRRNSRYADVGEVMELRGERFEVTKVYRQSLGELTDADAQAEGFPDVAAYRDSILSMHPGMPWLPHMQVWAHEFRKL